MSNYKPMNEMTSGVINEEANHGLIKMLNGFGIATNWGPMSPLYALANKRLETFSNFPEEKKHLVDSIAAAGFYYTGYSDDTRCFSCRLLVSNWLQGHDPWEHHALWGEDCAFVRTHKGAQYVYEVQKAWADYLSGENQNNSSAAMVRRVLNGIYHRIRGYLSSFYQLFFKLEQYDCDDNSNGDTEDHIDNELLCRLCNQRQRAVVYLPCRHMISCSECVLTDVCSVCEHTVRACVDVYLS